MKLSRTKIAKLLKNGNQSRKHRSKTLDNKAFQSDELILSKAKSVHIRPSGYRKQRTAHGGHRPVNLRLKTMKNTGWNNKKFLTDEEHVKQQGGKVPGLPRYKYVKAILAFKDSVKVGDDIEVLKAGLKKLEIAANAITTEKDAVKAKFTSTFKPAITKIAEEVGGQHTTAEDQKKSEAAKKENDEAQKKLNDLIAQKKEAAKVAVENKGKETSLTSQDVLNQSIKEAQEKVISDPDIVAAQEAANLTAEAAKTTAELAKPSTTPAAATAKLDDAAVKKVQDAVDAAITVPINFNFDPAMLNLKYTEATKPTKTKSVNLNSTLDVLVAELPTLHDDVGKPFYNPLLHQINFMNPDTTKIEDITKTKIVIGGPVDKPKLYQYEIDDVGIPVIDIVLKTLSLDVKYKDKIINIPEVNPMDTLQKLMEEATAYDKTFNFDFKTQKITFKGQDVYRLPKAAVAKVEGPAEGPKLPEDSGETDTPQPNEEGASNTQPTAPNTPPPATNTPPPATNTDDVLPSNSDSDEFNNPDPSIHQAPRSPSPPPPYNTGAPPYDLGESKVGGGPPKAKIYPLTVKMKQLINDLQLKDKDIFEVVDDTKALENLKSYKIQIIDPEGEPLSDVETNKILSSNPTGVEGTTGIEAAQGDIKQETLVSTLFANWCNENNDSEYKKTTHVLTYNNRFLDVCNEKNKSKKLKILFKGIGVDMSTLANGGPAEGEGDEEKEEEEPDADVAELEEEGGSNKEMKGGADISEPIIIKFQLRSNHYWFLHRLLNDDLYYLIDVKAIGRIVQMMIKSPGEVTGPKRIKQEDLKKDIMNKTDQAYADKVQEINEAGIEEENEANAEELDDLKANEKAKLGEELGQEGGLSMFKGDEKLFKKIFFNYSDRLLKSDVQRADVATRDEGTRSTHKETRENSKYLTVEDRSTFYEDFINILIKNNANDVAAKFGKTYDEERAKHDSVFYYQENDKSQVTASALDPRTGKWLDNQYEKFKTQLMGEARGALNQAAHVGFKRKSESLKKDIFDEWERHYDKFKKGVKAFEKSGVREADGTINELALTHNWKKELEDLYVMKGEEEEDMSGGAKKVAGLIPFFGLPTLAEFFTNSSKNFDVKKDVDAIIKVRIQLHQFFADTDEASAEIVRRYKNKNIMQKITWAFKSMTVKDYKSSQTINYITKFTINAWKSDPTISATDEANFKKDKNALEQLRKAFIHNYAPLVKGGGKDRKVGVLYAVSKVLHDTWTGTNNITEHLEDAEQRLSKVTDQMFEKTKALYEGYLLVKTSSLRKMMKTTSRSETFGKKKDYLGDFLRGGTNFDKIAEILAYTYQKIRPLAYDYIRMAEAENKVETVKENMNDNIDEIIRLATEIKAKATSLSGEDKELEAEKAKLVPTKTADDETPDVEEPKVEEKAAVETPPQEGTSGEGTSAEEPGSSLVETNLGGGGLQSAGAADLETLTEIKTDIESIKTLTNGIRTGELGKNVDIKIALKKVDAAISKLSTEVENSHNLLANSDALLVECEKLRELINKLSPRPAQSKMNDLANQLVPTGTREYGPPGGDLTGLLKRIADLEKALELLKSGKSDETKLTEDEAAIRAIMTGEDALSHKLKLLIDIPKWQQFRLIGDTGGSVEEMSHDLNQTVKGAEMKELERKITELLEKIPGDLTSFIQQVAIKGAAALKNPDQLASETEMEQSKLKVSQKDFNDIVTLITKLEKERAEAMGEKNYQPSPGLSGLMKQVETNNNLVTAVLMGKKNDSSEKPAGSKEEKQVNDMDKINVRIQQIENDLKDPKTDGPKKVKLTEELTKLNAEKDATEKQNKADNQAKLDAAPKPGAPPASGTGTGTGDKAPPAPGDKGAATTPPPAASGTAPPAPGDKGPPASGTGTAPGDKGPPASGTDATAAKGPDTAAATPPAPASGTDATKAPAPADKPVTAGGGKSKNKNKHKSNKTKRNKTKRLQRGGGGGPCKSKDPKDPEDCDDTLPLETDEPKPEGVTDESKPEGVTDESKPPAADDDGSKPSGLDLATVLTKVGAMLPPAAEMDNTAATVTEIENPEGGPEQGATGPGATGPGATGPGDVKGPGAADSGAAEPVTAEGGPGAAAAADSNAADGDKPECTGGPDDKPDCKKKVEAEDKGAVKEPGTEGTGAAGPGAVKEPVTEGTGAVKEPGAAGPVTEGTADDADKEKAAPVTNPEGGNKKKRKGTRQKKKQRKNKKKSRRQRGGKKEGEEQVAETGDNAGDNTGAKDPAVPVTETDPAKVEVPGAKDPAVPVTETDPAKAKPTVPAATETATTEAATEEVPAATGQAATEEVPAVTGQAATEEEIPGAEKPQSKGAEDAAAVIPPGAGNALTYLEAIKLEAEEKAALAKKNKQDSQQPAPKKEDEKKEDGEPGAAGPGAADSGAADSGGPGAEPAECTGGPEDKPDCKKKEGADGDKPECTGGPEDKPDCKKKVEGAEADKEGEKKEGEKKDETPPAEPNKDDKPAEKTTGGRKKSKKHTKRGGGKKGKKTKKRTKKRRSLKR